MRQGNRSKPLSHKVVAVLSWLYILFVIYNIFIPFTFDKGWGDLPEELGLIEWGYFMPLSQRLSLTDFFGNILLFMPGGALFYICFILRGNRKPLLISAVSCIVFSVLLETGQLFTSLRVSALSDVINNLIGGLIGAVVVIWIRRIDSSVRPQVTSLFCEQPFALLLVLILVAQTLAALMPFTVSITVSDFKQNIWGSNIAPFAFQSNGKQFVGVLSPHDLVPFDLMKFGERLLFWLPIG